MGGWESKWSLGTELYYRQERTAMMVDVSRRQFCDAEPRPLFEGLSGFAWDVSPSGDFVGVGAREPPRLNLALNWFDELERLAPPER